jgi:putative ABC transport system permease protein
VANQTILRRSGLRFRVFFIVTMPAYLITVAFCFLTFFIVLDVQTVFTARYIIPLGGMILGNILRGNIISLERLYHSLTRRQEEYIYYISMGASLREALIPFMGEALRSSIEPYLATISTMGLVSLPGMMTGQILGGASPLVAIQYQVMIMAAILVASSLSIFLVMTLSARVAFDPFGRLREKIFLAGRFRRSS